MWGIGQDTGALGLYKCLSQCACGEGKENRWGPEFSPTAGDIQSRESGRGGAEHATNTPNTSVQNSDPTGMALSWTKAIWPSTDNYSFQNLRDKNAENVSAQGFPFPKTLRFA